MNQQSASAASGDLADQLDLKTELSVIDGKSLQIRYQVANRSDEPIVLLNFVRQPMAEPEQDPDRAFVESESDGTVLITQRALVERVPSSKRPVHRAVLVDSGATASGEFALALPLQYANPEAPKAGQDIADPPERVQLRLAFVPASRFEASALEQIRDGEELRPISPDLPKAQGLLCSEVLQIS